MADSTARKARRKVPCNCVGCKGRKRTPKTAAKHESRPQKPISELKICYCKNCIKEHASGVVVNRKTFARHMAKHGKNSNTPIVDDNLLDIFEFDSSVDSEFDNDEDMSSADELGATYDDDDDLSLAAELGAACDEREELLRVMEQVEKEQEKVWQEEQDTDSDKFDFFSDASNNSHSALGRSDIDDNDDNDELDIDFDNNGGGKLQKEVDWIELIGPMTRDSQEKLVSFFNKYHPGIALPSIHRRNRRLEKRTGLQPIWYHCCVNSCMAFTGKYADITHCETCKEARYHIQRGRKKELLPRKKGYSFRLLLDF